MNLDALTTLKTKFDTLPAEDHQFAGSLITQFERKNALSPKQWLWVEKFAARIEKATSGIPDFTARLEVGDMSGVITLFADARKNGLKYPKIRMSLQLAAGVRQPVALTVAGDKSKHAGTINVTDGGPYHSNTWFGRISADGVWTPSANVSEQVLVPLVLLLTQLARNPAKTAAEQGKLVGHCCFCNSELSDERSKAVGYGATCAKKWKLPWGAVETKGAA